jgi:hypothetical protein
MCSSDEQTTLQQNVVDLCRRKMSAFFEPNHHGQSSDCDEICEADLTSSSDCSSSVISVLEARNDEADAEIYEYINEALENIESTDDNYGLQKKIFHIYEEIRPTRRVAEEIIASCSIDPKHVGDFQYVSFQFPTLFVLEFHFVCLAMNSLYRWRTVDLVQFSKVGI